MLRRVRDDRRRLGAAFTDGIHFLVLRLKKVNLKKPVDI